MKTVPLRTIAGSRSVGIGAVVGGLRKELDFRGAAVGDIQGVIQSDGLPLSGVLVQAFDASNTLLRSTLTSADGSYTLAVLPHGGIAVTASSDAYRTLLYDGVDCPGGVPAGCEASDGTIITLASALHPASIDFDLVAAARLSGTVSDGAAPVQAATVTVFDVSGAIRGSGTSDATGNFEVGGLPDGPVIAIATHPEHAARLYDGVPCPGGLGSGCQPGDGTQVSVSAGAEAGGIDFELSALGAVEGTVTSSLGGTPLAGVRIEVFDEHGSYVRDGFTAGDGSFSIAGLPSGPAFLTTDSGGEFVDELYDGVACPQSVCSVLAGTPIAIVDGATTGPLAIALAPLGTIEGTLAGTWSNSFGSSAGVHLYDAGGSLVATDGVQQDGDPFSFLGLEAGAYYLTASALDVPSILYDGLLCEPDCDPSTGTPIVLGPGETFVADLQFPPSSDEGAVIRGRVFDERTGQPSPARLGLYDASGVQLAYVDTADDAVGAYEFTGLAPGTVYLKASRYRYVTEGYMDVPCFEPAHCHPSQLDPLVLEAGTVLEDVDVDLEPQPKITGTVTLAAPDEDDRPSVRLYTAEGAQVASAGVYGGTYELYAVEPGDYYVVASADHHLPKMYDDVDCGSSVPSGCDFGQAVPVPATVGESVNGVDFFLDSLGRLLLEARDSQGELIADARFEIWGDANAYLWYANDGSAIARVHPGTYHVLATANGYFSTLLGDQTCQDCSVEDSEAVSLDLSEEIQRTITLPSGMRLRGLATDSSGAPIAGEPKMEFELTDQAGEDSWWDRITLAPDGSFDLQVPLLGYHLLSAYTEGAGLAYYSADPCSGACDELDAEAISFVPDGEFNGIEIALHFRGAVSGLVVDDQGDPVQADVELFDDQGNYLAYRTSYDGMYSFDADPGSYYVTATANNTKILFDSVDCPEPCIPTVGTPVLVEEHMTTEGVDFQFATVATTTATVSLEASNLYGTPIYGRIWLEHVDDGSVYNGTVNSSLEVPAGSYWAEVTASLHYRWIRGHGLCDELLGDPDCSPTVGNPLDLTVGDEITVSASLAQHGTVVFFPVDALGDPVPEVTLEIYDPGSSATTTRVSGEQAASLELPDGDYQLNASRAGYLALSKSFTVSEVESRRIPVILDGDPATIVFVDGFESADTTAWQ